MTSIPQLAESLQQILEKEARQLAKETGFIERERGFNGADFAQALILGWLQQPDERLDGFTQLLQRREVSITASGLSQRFTKGGPRSSCSGCWSDWPKCKCRGRRSMCRCCAALRRSGWKRVPRSSCRPTWWTAGAAVEAVPG
jgi:hypothetical protein